MGLNFISTRSKNSDPTSKKTQCISITKPNRLMLFREIIAVYCENHMEHTKHTVWAERGRRKKWGSSERHYILGE
jgi:hypothetical protein